jgi:histidine triad (HIT) family protein
MADCEYCELVQSRKNLLYEDEKLVAVVPEKPLAKGHVVVVAKEHHANIQDVEDKELQHLFYAASFGATALFENLGAHGTNILFNTGGQLKQDGHFHIDVLARWSEDKLNFLWTPNQLPEDELKSIQGKIKDKCDMLGVEKKDKEVVDLDKKPEKLESGGDKAPEETTKELAEEKEKVEKQEKGEQKKEIKEGKAGKKDKESYLIKQLRRMP